MHCFHFAALSILSGTTIADSNTTVTGSAAIGLDGPYGLATVQSSIETVIVTDTGNNRILQLCRMNQSTLHFNASLLAYNWTGGNSLFNPYNIFIDEKKGNNLYVSDSSNARIVLFPAMQSVSPPARVIAGFAATPGTALTQFFGPAGLRVDNQSNLFVADAFNNRIMRWSVNGTTGTRIAGLASSGAGSQKLEFPFDITLDESHACFYVADSVNHRIQRFPLYGGIPRNGTTVAGGNGQGSASNQLNMPIAIWISPKSGAIYIADRDNNRIQLWKPNATEGVTLAGDPQGNAGVTDTLLQSPQGIAVNANETWLYVSDGANNRIQRFQLI